MRGLILLLFMGALIIMLSINHHTFAASVDTATTTKKSVSNSALSQTKTTTVKAPSAKSEDSKKSTSSSSSSMIVDSDKTTSVKMNKQDKNQVVGKKLTPVAKTDDKIASAIKEFIAQKRAAREESEKIESAGKADSRFVFEGCDKENEFYNEEATCEGHNGEWIEGMTTSNGVLFYHCCTDTMRDDIYTMSQKTYDSMVEDIEEALQALEEYFEDCSEKDCKETASNAANEYANNGGFSYLSEGYEFGCEDIYGEGTDTANEEIQSNMKMCCESNGCAMGENKEGEETCSCSKEGRSSKDAASKISDVSDCVNASNSAVGDISLDCQLAWNSFYDGGYDMCRSACLD